MCAKRDGFAERQNFDNTRDYRNIARQLIEIVGEGTFWIVRATCPLEDLFGPKWPSDIVSHEFECLTCGRRFSRFADTYHGTAGWRPGDIEPPKSQGIS